MEDKPLPSDFEPDENTVMIGKGKMMKDNPGAGSKRTKTKVVKEIYDYIIESGGVFVRQGTSGGWTSVPETVAREKIGYVLRDHLADKYLSSSKSKGVRRDHELAAISAPRKRRRSTPNENSSTNDGSVTSSSSLPPSRASSDPPHDLEKTHASGALLASRASSDPPPDIILNAPIRHLPLRSGGAESVQRIPANPFVQTFPREWAPAIPRNVLTPGIATMHTPPTIPPHASSIPHIPPTIPTLPLRRALQTLPLSSTYNWIPLPQWLVVDNVTKQAVAIINDWAV
eukprot:Nitzschia sp. Nitz4//scaffold4_size323378//270309//271217//NITZ4_000705-RA/size323378-processed-gene-0.384-mRNA-1//-1//CDS//3329553534//5502//frame0